MTENMKKFAEQANQNEALKAELEALGKEYKDREAFKQNKAAINQKTAEIAAKYGFTLTEADFAAGKTELSEMELDAVFGGGKEDTCSCFVGGGGSDMGLDDEGWCACPVLGYGYGSDYSCTCTVLGTGKLLGR